MTTDHPYHLRRVVAMAADGSNCIVLAHRGCSVLADPVELATGVPATSEPMRERPS